MAAQTVFAQGTAGSLVSDNTAQTMGMQFSLSQSAPLTGIWWYSAPTATALPNACCIYQVTGTGTGSQVSGTVNTSPTWSGAAGSGWVKCTYPGTTTLASGTNYKVCVFYDGTSGTGFYSITSHYWDTGTGSGGITSGIITAPKSASADGGQDTFALVTGGLNYPGTSFNSANYWVDVEVTTAASQSGTATLTGGASVSAAAIQRATVTLGGAGSVGSIGPYGSGLYGAGVYGGGTGDTNAVQLAPATLTGTGSVTATGTTNSAQGTATLTGAGALTAPAAQRAPLTLTGAGALTAVAGGSVQATATLTGAGVITAPAVQLASATLTGAGLLTATSGSSVHGTASLAAAGTVSALAAPGGTAVLAGAGAFAGSVTLEPVAALAGNGSLTAAATVRGPFNVATSHPSLVPAGTSSGSVTDPRDGSATVS